MSPPDQALRPILLHTTMTGPPVKRPFCIRPSRQCQLRTEAYSSILRTLLSPTGKNKDRVPKYTSCWIAYKATACRPSRLAARSRRHGHANQQVDYTCAPNMAGESSDHSQGIPNSCQLCQFVLMRMGFLSDEGVLNARSQFRRSKSTTLKWSKCMIRKRTYSAPIPTGPSKWPSQFPSFVSYYPLRLSFSYGRASQLPLGSGSFMPWRISSFSWFGSCQNTWTTTRAYGVKPSRWASVIDGTRA